MSKVINNTLKRIARFLNAYVRKSEEKLRLAVDFKEYLITKPDELGEKIYQVKPHTIEKIKPLKIVDIIAGGELFLPCKEQYLVKYKNAIVCPNSDMIFLDDKVAWSKYHDPLFSKNKYRDGYVLQLVNDRVKVRSEGVKQLSFERVFSLCGVYAGTWSHFMIQYLPKLYMLKKEFLSEDIIILLHKKIDPQIVEIIRLYLEDYPKTELVFLDDNEEVLCGELYYMDSATQMIDHEAYVSYADMIIPNQVASLLKTQLVESLIKRYYKPVDNKDLKLYIRRNNAAYRNMMNVEEVEEFFLSEGFEIIEPHLLSLEKKVNYFRNASVVVGPNSAGFSNLIFSKPQTKVLLFSNLQRSFEPYLAFFYYQFELDFLTITGEDKNSADSHSDFYISLDKIKNIYSTFINQRNE